MTSAEIRRWLASFKVHWELANVEGITGLFSPHVTFQVSPFRPAATGRGAVESHWASELELVEEVQVDFGRPLVDGNRVAVEYDARVLKPDGAWAESGVLFLEFADGLCTHLREVWMVEERAPATI